MTAMVVLIEIAKIIVIIPAAGLLAYCIGCLVID